VKRSGGVGNIGRIQRIRRIRRAFGYALPGRSHAIKNDAAGNLTAVTGSSNPMTLTYDDRGRLKTALASGTTTTYSINYQQLRVRKGNANETKLFIYDDAGHMLGEYDAAGNAIQELIWLNDTPVAVTGTLPCLTSTTNTNSANGAIGNPTCVENATAFIFTDHLNTPREVARIGASAANGNNANGYTTIWKWDSLPFGETLPNQNPSGLGVLNFNHRFPGQYFDTETGLHQNWFREYDPKVSRYVQSDPIGLKGGTNTYGYVLSSPLNATDKLGLCTVVVVDLNGIGHAGVYVDRGEDGKPFIYDPGGSYRVGTTARGSGDTLYGRDANLDAYIAFQRQAGPNVQVFRFDTTAQEEKQIAANAEEDGGRSSFQCVLGTRAAIRGVGPFKDLGRGYTGWIGIRP
jgi:RHS repeat-associated protein